MAPARELQMSALLHVLSFFLPAMGLFPMPYLLMSSTR